MYRSVFGDFPIRSLYFGGGTPSLFNHLEALIEYINPPKGIEITLEANPEDITEKKMRAFRKMGINRVSIGVQSLVDTELLVLGRMHDRYRAINAVWDVYNAGISNITIDLMYETPLQTLSSFESTLDAVSVLPITHLSLYNLTIEERTVYKKNEKEILPLLPSSEMGMSMLNLAIDSLKEMGLSRYEISAFAKQGFEAEHNTGYWKGVPFIGFGPSAFSYLGGARFSNVKHLKRYSTYLKKGIFPVDFFEKLGGEAALSEKLAVALRLLKGVKLSEMPPLTKGIELELQKLQGTGHLQLHGSRLKLTQKGINFYDDVGTALTTV